MRDLCCCLGVALSDNFKQKWRAWQTWCYKQRLLELINHFGRGRKIKAHCEFPNRKFTHSNLTDGRHHGQTRHEFVVVAWNEKADLVPCERLSSPQTQSRVSFTRFADYISRHLHEQELGFRVWNLIVHRFVVGSNRLTACSRIKLVCQAQTSRGIRVLCKKWAVKDFARRNSEQVPHPVAFVHVWLCEWCYVRCRFFRTTINVVYDWYIAEILNIVSVILDHRVDV